MPKIFRRDRRRKAHLVLLDESGFMYTPTVRRPLAPRGKTSILRSRHRNDRISAISAVLVSPKRRRLGLSFNRMSGDVNTHGEEMVAFLKHVHRQIPGPMRILRDRNSIHDRSKVVQAYLAKHPEVETERLPGYASAINPVEMVRQYSKVGRTSNYTPEDSAELRAAWVEELEHLHREPEMLAAFILIASA